MNAEIEKIKLYFDNAIRIGLINYLKTNDGFQINNTEDGYESDNFSEDIQQKIGISLKSSTYYNYGGDFELVFDCKGELLEILQQHKMETEFLALFENRFNSQELYLIKGYSINFKIIYPLKKDIYISQASVISVANKLDKLFTFINLIDHAY
jgi:hypothetical protein